MVLTTDQEIRYHVSWEVVSGQRRQSLLFTPCLRRVAAAKTALCTNIPLLLRVRG